MNLSQKSLAGGPGYAQPHPQRSEIWDIFGLQFDLWEHCGSTSRASLAEQQPRGFTRVLRNFSCRNPLGKFHDKGPILGGALMLGAAICFEGGKSDLTRLPLNVRYWGVVSTGRRNTHHEQKR